MVLRFFRSTVPACMRRHVALRCMRRAMALFAPLVLLLSSLSPAAAAVVTGTFRGIAQNTYMGGTELDPLDFDGAPVTGSFRFDPAAVPADAPTDDDTPTTRMRFLPSGSVYLTFHVLGRTLAFGGVEGWEEAVEAEITPTGQTVGLVPVPEGGSASGSLRLAGPLLDGLDLSTFGPGPVDLDASTANFFESRYFLGGVRLTEVRFDAQTVPEPGSAVLWLAALAALARWRLWPGRPRPA